MPVKLRFARGGRKDAPMYRLVATDARAPRDGRFIKKLGTYNPNTSPATVTLKEDQILDWLNKGAQPTETARSLFSATGLLLVKHLAEGVQKGAITKIIAKKRFMDWHKIATKKTNKKVNTLFTPEAVDAIFNNITPASNFTPKAKAPAKPKKEAPKKKATSKSATAKKKETPKNTK